MKRSRSPEMAGGSTTQPPRIDDLAPRDVQLGRRAGRAHEGRERAGTEESQQAAGARQRAGPPPQREAAQGQERRDGRQELGRLKRHETPGQDARGNAGHGPDQGIGEISPSGRAYLLSASGASIHSETYAAAATARARPPGMCTRAGLPRRTSAASPLFIAQTAPRAGQSRRRGAAWRPGRQS